MTEAVANDRTVVQVDFGRAERGAQDRLARLIGLVDKRHADVRADPVKFLGLAHDEIIRLRLLLRNIQEAASAYVPLSYGDPTTLQSMNTLVVPREDYEALQRVRALIEGFE